MYFYNHFSAYSKIKAGNDRKIQKYSDGVNVKGF